MTGGYGSCGSDPTTTGGETEGILGSDLTCGEAALKGKKAQRGGYTCCVPGCFNNTKKDRELSFHKFPREKVLRNVWINAIKRKDFVPTEHHRDRISRSISPQPPIQKIPNLLPARGKFYELSIPIIR